MTGICTDSSTFYCCRLGVDDVRYVSGPMMRLSGRIRLTKEDGTDIDPEARVTLCNNFANSWIKRIGIRVGNQTINLSRGVNFYWKNVISNILNYGDDVRSGSLRASGVYNSPDICGDHKLPEMEDLHSVHAWPHLMEIRKRCANSKWVDFCTGESPSPSPFYYHLPYVLPAFLLLLQTSTWTF